MVAPRHRLDEGRLACAGRAVEEVGALVRDAMVLVPLRRLVGEEVVDVLDHALLRLLGQHDRLELARGNRGVLRPILIFDVPAVHGEGVGVRLVGRLEQRLAEAGEKRQLLAPAGAEDEALEEVDAAV